MSGRDGCVKKHNKSLLPDNFSAASRLQNCRKVSALCIQAMKYQRIHIIGGPGSGKSYIARRLSEKYALPHYDLDDIFWDRNHKDYIRSSEETRQRRLETILANETWIIEGVYYKWLEMSFEGADKIVVLNTPLVLRQWRVLRRYLYYKVSRAHEKNETIANLIEMMRWNQKYDRANLARFYAFSKAQEYKIVACNSLSEVERAINA